MSRIGKMPISFDKSLNISKTEYGLILKNGESQMINRVSPFINIDIDKETRKISLSVKKDSKAKPSRYSRAMYGTERSKIKSSIDGIANEHHISLELIGVGYKASISENLLLLNLGYSHDIIYSVPSDLKVSVEKSVVINLLSKSKDMVGQVASEITNLRPHEPYKGKGIKIKGQMLIRKEGKKK